MTVQKQREIVIEFEKVQMIRKRAKTAFAFCAKCGGDADFVGLGAATILFETRNGDLATFISSNGVHTHEDIGICIPSLLAIMHSRQTGATRMIGNGRNEIK
jgi:hypothetical protein